MTLICFNDQAILQVLISNYNVPKVVCIKRESKIYHKINKNDLNTVLKLYKKTAGIMMQVFYVAEVPFLSPDSGQ